jgi:general nucleoside transport system ATP-binding protein
MGCSSPSASFQAAGRSVVFISHKLREHREIADRITVLRRGRSIGTVDARTTEPQELAT